MNTLRTIASAVSLACISAHAVPACADSAIPSGKAALLADLGGTSLPVFTYRPTGCTSGSILVVFHGLERNAADYRDHAIPLGDRLCMLVVAPMFDKETYPTWRYQRGGIVHDGKLVPEAEWTVSLVPRLVAWVRAQEGKPALPYSLIGHSAGGQFLSRVAAFAPIAARHIVIANPSTWVLPSLNEPAPYGFAGVYPPDQAQDALRRYLAAPITVLLGADDTGSKNLATDNSAQSQGATRLERGQKVFYQAEATARAHNWPFHWQVALVQDVGHDAAHMFSSKEASDALRP